MSAFYSALLVCIGGLYSASGLANTEPATAIESPALEVKNTAREPALGRNVLAAQAVQLGPEAKQLIDLTTPVEHFSALFLAANVAQPRGIVILLAGAEESFDWPEVIGPLRRKLPDAGWHTLSLNLPEPPPNTLTSNKIIADPVAEQIPVLPPTPLPEPEETESIDDDEPIEPEPEPEEELAPEPTDEVAVETDNAKSEPAPLEPIVIPEYPQRISNLLDAAVAYGQTIGATEIILLGHHEGAHWILDYQNQHAATLPTRLAMIAARSTYLIDRPYETLIAANTQPLADFYYKINVIEQQAAQQRLAASRRANRKTYQQIGLTTASGVQAIEQERLFRRVKGWLNKANPVQ
ncbi:DUF3530 family protein [Denitrificimonas caeni]|uniref:DUF3530 family protein n=1 Tax=Denitrificimonas caeni TaxID=521720 RepID=UPI001966B98A|nr:DUF3530 family protein [Denitrificimonas caeni]